MKSRRSHLTLIFAVFLPVLLFHFQNCAPARAPMTTGGGTAYLPDQSHQLEFVTQNVQVQDDAASTEIEGFCDSSSDGVGLHWSLASESGSALISGSSICRGGQFALSLGGLDDVTCGVGHMLIVQSDSGDSGSANFVRRCQPLATLAIPTPADSPGGTTCQLEYTPANSVDQQCVQACYRASMLVSNESLDISQCSNLATGLAGP